MFLIKILQFNILFPIGIDLISMKNIKYHNDKLKSIENISYIIINFWNNELYYSNFI